MIVDRSVVRSCVVVCERAKKYCERATLKALAAFAGPAPAAVNTPDDFESTASEFGVLAAFIQGWAKRVFWNCDASTLNYVVKAMLHAPTCTQTSTA